MGIQPQLSQAHRVVDLQVITKSMKDLKEFLQRRDNLNNKQKVPTESVFKMLLLKCLNLKIK